MDGLHLHQIAGVCERDDDDDDNDDVRVHFTSADLSVYRREGIMALHLPDIIRVGLHHYGIPCRRPRTVAVPPPWTCHADDAMPPTLPGQPDPQSTAWRRSHHQSWPAYTDRRSGA